MYIYYVALRERTNYFSTSKEILDSGLPEGFWVNVNENEQGSAVVKPEISTLEFLDEVNNRATKNDLDLGEFPVVVNENTGEVVFVDCEGKPVAFNEVMNLLFG